MSKDDGKLKRGPVIHLNPVTEKDLYDTLDKMSNKGNLGHLVTHLIRIVYESPEAFDNTGEVKRAIVKMQELGMTPTRYKYFDKLAKDVGDIRKKVDSIYDIAYKTYMLGLMNKYMGIEARADSSLKAAFILERQIDQMCESLGITDMNHTYESNKLEDVHERASKVFEYILESYDGIIQELKAGITSPVAITVDRSVLVDTHKVAEVEKTKQESESTNTDTADEEYIDLIDRPEDIEETSKASGELRDMTAEQSNMLMMWSQSE